MVREDTNHGDRIMFLRYHDNLEQDKADTAALEGKKYTNILEKQFRWI